MHVAFSVLRISCDAQAAGEMGLLAGVPSAHGARRQAVFLPYQVSFMALSLQSYNEEFVSMPVKCLQLVNGSC